jgi:L-2,4-diaminobutyrate decarboxylase
MGASGIGTLHDTLCDSAVQLKAELERSAGITALHEPESNILCWRQSGGTAIDHTTTRREINSSGLAWITVTTLSSTPVLRVTIMNPRSSSHDLTNLVREFTRIADR